MTLLDTAYYIDAQLYGAGAFEGSGAQWFTEAEQWMCMILDDPDASLAEMEAAKRWEYGDLPVQRAIAELIAAEHENARSVMQDGQGRPAAGV